MTIGVVSYLSPKRDEAYITSLCKSNYDQKFHFKPSEVDFKLTLYKIVALENNRIIKFELKKHLEFIDIQFIKSRNHPVRILYNIELIDFIIMNDLDDNRDSDLQELRAIDKLLRSHHNPIFYGEIVVLDNLEDLIKQYKISYGEGGYNKPGDWSKAWITVSTNRPSNLPNYKLDNYLDKLLPKFDIHLGRDEDDINHKFKNDILRKLRDQVGNDNIESIKKLCNELSVKIQDFSLLTYNPREHAKSLQLQKNQLKSRIYRKYQEGARNI